MQALVRARMAIDWPAVRFHPGDLDWWLVQAFGREPAIEERVRLWFDADAAADDEPGAPRAYGWFSRPGDLDFVIASEDPIEVDALTAELVGWADERRTTLASDPPAELSVWVATTERAAASLSALGFVADGKPGYVVLTGELAPARARQGPALPDGFSIRSIAADADVEARVVCGRAAFAGSTMTVERYRQTFDANLYRRELDLIVVDNAGRVVAFALGWLDPPSAVVELEPVGVDPDFHRRGLGRQICRAVLDRARELGATRALIASERGNAAAVGLYQSLGLVISTEIVPYARPPSAGGSADPLSR